MLRIRLLNLLLLVSIGLLPLAGPASANECPLEAQSMPTHGNGHGVPVEQQPHSNPCCELCADIICQIHASRKRPPTVLLQLSSDDSPMENVGLIEAKMGFDEEHRLRWLSRFYTSGGTQQTIPIYLQTLALII